MLRAIQMSQLSQDCRGSLMQRRLVYSSLGLVVAALQEWMSLYRLFQQMSNDQRVGYFLLVCLYTAGYMVVSCIWRYELWAGLMDLELTFASMYSMLAGGLSLLVILLISQLVSSLWVLWLACIHSALMGVLEGPDISYQLCAVLESGMESDCQWLLLVLE